MACSIPIKHEELAYLYMQDPTDYNILANRILESEESGYFYDISKVANDLEEEIKFLLEDGEVSSFSKQKLINTFSTLVNNKKILMDNSFFSQPLVDLYKDGNDPMQYMLNTFEIELIKIAFIDPNADPGKELTINDSILNDKVQSYKNKLFKRLHNHLSKNYSHYKNIPYQDLFINGKFNKESNYKTILNDIASLFKDSSLNVSIYNPKVLDNFLDIYNSAVILTNFDTLIDQKFKNIISVNQTNFNALSAPISTFQYFQEFKGVKTEYWNRDSHESSSIENYTSSLTKMLTGTIPLLDANGKIVKNQYLGDRLYLIGALIKTFNIDSDINYQDNPKKVLKWFLETLVKSKKIEYLGALNSLYEYLYGEDGVVEIIENVKRNNPELSPNIIDIEAIIAHQINNISPITYGSYSLDEDKVLLNLIERESKSDEISDSIIKHIINNSNQFSKLKLTKDSIIYKGVLINFENKEEVKKLISDLTGLDVTEKIRSLYNLTLQGSKESINKAIINILTKGVEVLKVLKNNEDKTQIELRNILSSDSYVNALVTSIIAGSNPSAMMNFKNTKGDNIPTIKQSNLASEIKTILGSAKHAFKTANGIFFLENEKLIKGNETVLEVKTAEGSAVSALYLNPEENFFLNFVENYIKPISKQKSEKTPEYLSFKLVNFSDKSTISNLLIDQFTPITFNGKTYDSLQKMSAKEISKLSNESIHSYYSEIIDKIFINWSQLIDKDGKPLVPWNNVSYSGENRIKYINKINSFLTDFWAKNGKDSENKFRELIRISWSKNKDLTFVEEVHFSKYKDGFKFNKTIEDYFSKSNNSQELNEIFENTFAQKLSEIEFNTTLSKLLDLGKYKTLKFQEEKINNLSKLLNEPLDNWIKLGEKSKYDFIYYRGKVDGVMKEFKQIPSIEEFKELKITDIELNPLLAKWLHTQNLVRYGYLGIVTKHEYQHPQKTGLEYKDIEFVKEMTSRSISMTKRMVIYPATMEYYMQGLDEGIPASIKLAVVKDTKAISANFSGDKAVHDAMDGSLFANPFLGYLLKKSLPNKGLTDVQKSIGHSSSDTHSTFLKCALFTFNNEMIKKSMGSEISLDNIMKKMNNIQIDPTVDISKTQQNNAIELNQFAQEGVYYKSGNKIIQVKKFEKISDNDYKIFLVDINTEELFTETKTINNLYDLWSVFGGAYSVTPSHGEYIWSEDSINIVGGLIATVKNSFGETVLKDKMIGILAQETAVKNGATNVNSSETLKDENELMYSNFDTHFFGVQLDAYHVSDESVINEVSQVIAALAENQSTPEFYSELYKAIGNIVDLEIKEYNRKYKKTGTYDLVKISNEFVRSLKNAKQLGNANEIINSLRQNGIENLPFSNNNFFNQFVINVMSKLKSDFIKRKYPGIATVLNPSYGIIQMYEDANGQTYFHDDMLSYATDLDLVEHSNINEKNKLIIDNVIKRMFPNQTIANFNLINPLDVILVNNPNAEKEEDKLKEYDLKDITDYYKLKQWLSTNPEGVTIQKITNRPRDLKPVQITFNQDGIYKNIFDIDPIRLTWGLEHGFLSDNDKIILDNFAKYFNVPNINYNDLTKDYIKSKLKTWSQRSFELLANGFNYINADINTDFALMFNDDDLVSKLDLSKYIEGKYISEIYNYNHKPAEVILPKVYRSEFGIGTDSFATINSQGVNYFKKNLSNLLIPKTKECDLFLTSTNGNSLYISVLDLTAEELEAQGYEKLNITTKEIDGDLFRTDIKGNPLYKLTKFKISGGNEDSPKIYLKDGVEFIVFPKKAGYIDDVRNFIKETKGSYDLIYPFNVNIGENFKEVLEIVKDYSHTPLYNSLLNSLVKKLVTEESESGIDAANAVLSDILSKNINLLALSEEVYNNFESLTDTLTNELAESMYASWLKSNDVVSARIPSQAMQSFMSMKNVGYIEEVGNNVYVSHVQLWLQGSDLDIDKAYIMMHGFQNGIYKGWSPFFRHDSYSSIKLSEKLPIPNKNKYILSNEGIDLTEFTNQLLLKSPQGKLMLNDIVTLLNLVKDSNVIKNDPSNSKLYTKYLGIINKHNSFDYSTSSIKNFVVRNIIETSNHPNNQISSYTPIDFGKYTEIKKNSENNFILSLGDGISMDQQQQSNAVGKDVIGIAANGIKDYFALVEYFTNYYDGNVLKSDNKYFEREFNIGGKIIKVNRIAGLKLKQDSINIINNYIARETGIENIFDSNRDPSLVLSSLLSASTDNAKELILKAINAGKEFASMHVYMIILGFDEGEVANFMNSKSNTDILKELKWNIFIDEGFAKSLDNTVNAKEGTEFKKIYNLAKELNSLSRILKINQGLSSSADALIQYFDHIQSDFITREIQFLSDTNKINTKDFVQNMVDRVLLDKPYLIPDKLNVQNIIESATNLEISGKRFSFEKYFSNSDYKIAAINYYNLIKGTFNILDVVESLPHFKNMVNATKMSYDQMKQFSRKFDFVVNDVVKILETTNISSFESSHKIKGTSMVSLSEKQINKAFEVFDDLVISKWLLHTMSTKSIDLKKLSEQYPDWDIKIFNGSKENGKFDSIKDNDDAIISFSNDESLANFKQLVENNIVPYLKKNFTNKPGLNNSLLNGLLIRSNTIDRSRTWLSTFVRMGKASDQKSADVMFNYQQGMDELDNIEIMLGDNVFKASDLLFLYNLIVNKDKSGKDRLTKLFSKYIGNSGSLAQNLYQYYVDIDSGKIPFLQGEIDKSIRDAIIFGVLNNKGILKRTDDDTSPIRLPNSNFTMSTGVSITYQDPKKIKVYQELLNLVQSKNLLINFNCE